MRMHILFPNWSCAKQETICIWSKNKTRHCNLGNLGPSPYPSTKVGGEGNKLEPFA